MQRQRRAQSSRVKNQVVEFGQQGPRQRKPDDLGLVIGKPMAAGNLTRRTAGLTEGVSGCRGAYAQDSRGRDKRKLQIHAILPR